MRVFLQGLVIPLRWVIFVVFVLLVLVAIALFQWLSAPAASSHEKLFLIFAGLIPGLLVALGQYVLAWFEFKDRDRLRALQIQNVLATRDDREYYATLLKRATRRV